MQPNRTHRTDRRVEVFRREGGTYLATCHGAPDFEGDILNVGGRACAFPASATLELGGGKTTIVLKEYDDGRAGDDGTLVAIGFVAEAVL